MGFVKAKVPLKGGGCGRCPDVEKLETRVNICNVRTLISSLERRLVTSHQETSDGYKKLLGQLNGIYF
jgi:hypothetical protein